MIAHQRHVGAPFGLGATERHPHHPRGEAPVGSVIAFAGAVAAPLPGGASPPDSPPASPGGGIQVEALGWLLCDGRALASGAYPELFLALGTLYGGSGGYFHLPDYRGYFLRGSDGGSGRDPDLAARIPPAGASSPGEVGSVQRDAVLAHYHQYDTGTVEGVTTGSGQAAAKGTAPQTSSAPVDSAGTPLTPATGGSAGESRPKNVYVNYLIKFTNWPLRTR
ncbi:tail fiber protein [Massilia mucilaginosa]|nr:tail fiber protein [Massilia mucilaginosa]